MKKSIGMAFLILMATGCARSQEYARKQEVVDEPVSYYNRADEAPQPPTQRLAQLGQPKKRIVVFNFWNDTPTDYKELGTFAADELRRELHQTERLILPQDLRTQLETSDFIQGDKVRVAQLIQEGRRMGVAVLVIGRIKRVLFRQRGDEVGLFRQKQSLAAADVEIKMFDVAAGREMMASAHAGESSNNAVVTMEGSDMQTPEYRAELIKLAIREAMKQFTNDVIRGIEKMTWQGAIAKITGQKVYLNSGRVSGLVGGDILKVLTKGDDVYDPETGAYLGRSQGQLKGTLEVVDFIGEDAAVANIHTGGQFQEGDVVRLY
ncbi:MAG: hypothetical protein AB7P04_12465 [Bacteriovoracia bacterium]